MESVNNDGSEQSRFRSPSPQNNDETQRENEERFNMLQREMSSLKAVMEKLLEQYSERMRQVVTAPTTSLFAVQSSNKMHLCCTSISFNFFSSHCDICLKVFVTSTSRQTKFLKVSKYRTKQKPNLAGTSNRTSSLEDKKRMTDTPRTTNTCHSPRDTQRRPEKLRSHA